MKGLLTQLLLSLSLAVYAYCADSAAIVDDSGRNKRSLQSESAQRPTKTRLPMWLRRDHHQTSKRNNFDSLLFDDLIWDEPTEPTKPEKDELSNVIPGADYLPSLEEPEPAYPGENLASNLLEEFVTFLELKKDGLLDFCMQLRRR